MPKVAISSIPSRARRRSSAGSRPSFRRGSRFRDTLTRFGDAALREVANIDAPILVANAPNADLKSLSAAFLKTYGQAAAHGDPTTRFGWFLVLEPSLPALIGLGEFFRLRRHRNIRDEIRVS